MLRNVHIGYSASDPAAGTEEEKRKNKEQDRSIIMNDFWHLFFLLSVLFLSDQGHMSL